MTKYLLFLLVVFTGTLFSAQHIMTVDDMWKMQRVSGMQVDPISGIVVLKVRSFNMEENSSTYQYIAYHPNLAKPEKLFNSDEKVREIVWQNGKIRALIHSDEGTLLKEYDLVTKSWTELYSFPYPVNNLVSNTDLIAVYANEDPRATSLSEALKFEQQRLSAPSSGQIFTSLLYRHWDNWRDGKYNHLYLLDMRNKVPHQLVGGKRDVPPVGLGSSHDIVISPGGQAIAFVRNPDPMPAASTNNEIYLYSHVSKEIKKISKSPGNDNSPLFSPNGRYLAFLSMARGGFEADQQRIWIYDLRDDKLKEMGYDLDRSVSDFIWSKDAKTIYFTADNEGYRSLYELDVVSHNTKLLKKEVFITDMALAPGENELYLLNQNFNLPTELFSFNVNNSQLNQLTFFNDKILSEISFGKVNDFKFIGADQDTIHGWLIYPLNFNPKKKYGLLHIIHGGPQGAIDNSFHYRWNMQLFSSFGYVVAAINFHGSTGYGQKFTDRISKDWGGAPYQDIMKGTNYLIKNYSFIDSSRMVAAGASYGGFMINWIEGHSDRFKALVCHDGVFDQFSMYGATEELWFPEWEMDGTPYENITMYQKFSPSYYVRNMKTPMLIVHGQHDYRVPVTQGMQLFTALQRNGIPSKFLYFPDETHFVQKPRNAKLWWNTIYDWFVEYIGKGTSKN